MKYVPTSILVNIEDWNALPAGKRCQIIRKFIKDYVNSEKQDIDGINIELLQANVTQIRNEMVKLSTELQSKETQLKTVEERRDEQLRAGMEAEKNRLESLKKCVKCGKMLDLSGKTGKNAYKFSIGNVCKACYFLLEAKDIKELEGKE